LSYTTKIIIL